MSEQISTFDRVFIALLLIGLWTIVIIMPTTKPLEKVFPAIALLLATTSFVYLLRLLSDLQSQNTILLEERILERLEGKKYDPFKENAVSWLFTCLLEARRETRPLFFNFTREKSLISLGVFLRNARRHLNPNWYCSSCGRQVRWNFKPLVDCVADPLLDENAGFFAPVRIGCVDCDAFFEQKVEEVFFDV